MISSDPYLVLHRAIDVYERLNSAGIDAAIGGALALAYHVEQPRTTDDVDINVSLPAARAREVLELLPDDIPWDDEVVRQIARDDQVRLQWPVAGEMPMPLDLFFIADGFHELVRSRVVTVTMLDAEVRVLAATDLTIFKALFDRSKDWPDIEAMLDAHDSTVDPAEAIQWVESIVGPDDHRAARLRRLARPRPVER